MSTGGWVFMVLGMLVLIAVIVVLVFWLLNQQRRSHGHPAPAGLSPREALDHRLVNGEITGERYDELRARLSGGSVPGGEGPAPPAV